MNARPLFAPPLADGNLSQRQQIIYDLLQSSPNGVRAIDAGNHLHRTKTNPCLYCSDLVTCAFASRDANQVLDSLRGSPNDPRARRLVVRRRDGRWELRRRVRVADDTEIPF